ncbi:MAG: N-acetylmuramoyl-L-alanine amidase [Massiliimalia sp.]|jgi:glucan-binding YG repeat protein
MKKHFLWKNIMSIFMVFTLVLTMGWFGTGNQVQAASAPKIYLSPSKQDHNYYTSGETTEMVQCNRIAQAAEVALLRCGFQVKRAPMGQDMYESIAQSNAWGADLHVPIHTNAKDNKRPDHGTLMLVYDESAMRAAQCIQNQISALTLSHLKQPIEINRSFAELNSTKAMAVYTEVEYHDNAETSQWIIDNAEAVGEAICKGICDYYGYGYVPPCQWENTAAGRRAVKDGRVLTGWLQDGTGWYYLNGQGIPMTGWQSIGGGWYWFDSNGKMKTGRIEVNGQSYYLQGSGRMSTGWAKAGADWYYCNASGQMLTGWQYVNGKWYYMDPQTKKMRTGWLQTQDGSWYLLDANGAMCTGWHLAGNVWYFMDASGKMAVGSRVINGVLYQFNDEGAWIA